MQIEQQAIRLTTTVKKGGCAAKLPAGELRQALASLNLPTDPCLAVGTQTFDDACLWDLNTDEYLVQTLDFFTPIVDDPFDFGSIAAANSMSDVYAMGGLPRLVLSILAFPTAHLDMKVMKSLMEGAVAKIKEAGAVLAGGHTIDDETLKFGFSVTGFVQKQKAWTNSGAQPGDVLILTKGLGTGTITSALKTGQAKAEWVQAATDSMKQLNDVPRYIDGASIRAATDITGFGLAGHAMQMAQASQVSLEIKADSLPVLPGALECLDAGNLNRAHKTNAHYVADHVCYVDVPEALRLLTVDAQTSGGLLLAVKPNEAATILSQLTSRFGLSKVIGVVVPQKSEYQLRFSL